MGMLLMHKKSWQYRAEEWKDKGKQDKDKDNSKEDWLSLIKIYKRLNKK